MAVKMAKLRAGDILSSKAAGLRFELCATIGAGAFGEVWRCSDRLHGDVECAVKVMSVEHKSAVADEVDKMKRASVAVGAFHVPEFFGDAVCELSGGRSSYYAIAMQLIDGTSLSDLTALQRLKEPPSRAALRDVLLALGRLHTNGILHRDVKGSNVLVNKKGVCYLCDFGVSLFLLDVDPSGEIPQAGTPLYMAPEMVKTSPVRYDDKVDVWSFGVMAYELAAGFTPLQAHAEECPAADVVFSRLRTLSSPMLPDGTGFSADFQDLTEACLTTDPEERPRAEDLFSMGHLAGGKADRDKLAAAVTRHFPVTDAAPHYRRRTPSRDSAE